MTATAQVLALLCTQFCTFLGRAAWASDPKNYVQSVLMLKVWETGERGEEEGQSGEGGRHKGEGQGGKLRRGGDKGERGELRKRIAPGRETKGEGGWELSIMCIDTCGVSSRVTVVTAPIVIHGAVCRRITKMDEQLGAGPP